MPPPFDEEATIFISTGEVSGDIIGARLAESLRAANPDVKLSGLGGSRMAAAGVNILFDTTSLGSVDIPELITISPGILKAFGRVRSHIRTKAPKVAILISHEAFHILLGRWLRARNILTIAYFPPQVWLWQRLVRPIAKSFDWILTSFVQEHQTYNEAGARTVFVGHYLRDQLKETSRQGRKAMKQATGFKTDCPVVGLLPGSRMHEVDGLTPLLLDTARKLLTRESSIQFVLPVADPYLRGTIERLVQASGLAGSVRIENDGRTAIEVSDVVIVCSGTATLEAALMGVPMIIIYRISRTTWLNVKLLKRAGLIESEVCGIPNLLAGSRIVPELHQSEVTPEILADQAWDILRDPQRQAQMRASMRTIYTQLGEKGGTERVVHTILEKLAEVSRNHSDPVR